MNAVNEPASNAAAWVLACRLFFCNQEPIPGTAVSDAEHGALARLADLRAVKNHKQDLRFALCPYCQLLRGPVSGGSSGLVCQCPDCGLVPLGEPDMSAWIFDVDWLIRKLRLALDVSSQQAVVPVISGVWRIGAFQRRQVLLARSLRLALQGPAIVDRVSARKSAVPWLITPKPLRDIDSDPCNGSAVWLPLEERFSLYGGNLHFIEPGMRPGSTSDDISHAVHGPFSEDFMWVHLPEWQHGPIALTQAQAAVYRALWHFRDKPQEAHVIMARAGLKSEKPIDVFKIKSQNKSNLKYEGPAFSYRTLVQTDQHAGTYALLDMRNANSEESRYGTV